jgi:hypothetical protein
MKSFLNRLFSNKHEEYVPLIKITEYRICVRNDLIIVQTREFLKRQASQPTEQDWRAVGIPFQDLQHAQTFIDAALGRFDKVGETLSMENVVFKT